MMFEMPENIEIVDDTGIQKLQEKLDVTRLETMDFPMIHKILQQSNDLILVHLKTSNT